MAGAPPDSPSDTELARDQRRALAWAALPAAAAILVLLRPIGMAMLLGTLSAFIFRPVYDRLVSRRHWSPTLAALTTVLGSTAALGATLGGIAWILVHDGTQLGEHLLASLGPGGGGRRVAHAVAQVTTRLGITASEVETKARSWIDGATAYAVRIAEGFASTTASALLALLFVMLTMHFVLRSWDWLSAAARDILPLRPDYTRKIFEQFERVGRVTLLGTLLTALLQGTFATVGYALVGLPHPLFFGALTAVASPVPGIGTMLVWAPAGIVLILLGRLAGGIFLLAWGVLIVSGLMDYVVRPRLVGQEAQMPAVLTFAALFGGAAVFGLKGLILGPIIMAVAISVLRLYAEESRTRRASTPQG